MCLVFGAKFQHTTAFYPASNGMNESWNKSLKVALKSQENATDWLSNLSMVLLRAVVKEELECLAAEMTFEMSLRLPGEFFDPAYSILEPDPNHDSSSSSVFPLSERSDYAKWLSDFMNSLRYTQPKHPSNRRTYIDFRLHECSHVFVRIDSVRTPLQRPYSGPQLVLERHEKYFALDLNGKVNSVSIDRLKPCNFLELNLISPDDQE